MAKKTVAVIFGGQSTEHDISIVTAVAAVIKPLRNLDEFAVLPVYITKEGYWYAGEKFGDISLYRSGELYKYLAEQKRLLLELGSGLTLVQPGFRPKRHRIDVVFPTMHGTNGEDGALMGLLEMANIPYVGCGLAASVIAMDKILSKTVASANSIAVAKYRHCSKIEYERSPATFIKDASTLRLPLFVKPPHLGSSIGITRITEYAQLENAIEVALHYDDTVLVEEAIHNLIEVTVPVMGNENSQAALVERPLVKSDDFFDFDTKYISGDGKKSGGKKGAQGYSELPAKLDEALYARAEQTALQVYKIIGCSGIARIDLLIDSKSKQIYFNEINPMPGDLYKHNWQRAGVSPVELVRKLIDAALLRHEEKQRQVHSFSTNYLKQF